MKSIKQLVLTVGVLLALIVAAVFVLSEAGHYTLHTAVFASNGDIQPQVSVSFEPEGVAELADYYIQGEELVLELNAVGKGETMVSYSYQFFDPSDAATFEPVKHEPMRIQVGLFNIMVGRVYGSLYFNGWLAVVIAILWSLALTEVVMIWGFFDYRKKGAFGYPMIACGGVGIYLFVLLLFLVYKLLNNVVLTLGHFLGLVSETGIYLLMALTPVMLVLSVMLSISNIWLMRNEGRRPVNALGIVFGALWFIGASLTVGAGFLPVDVWSFPGGSFVRNILIYIIAYFECMFLSTVACSYLSTKYLPAFDRDYIIILGCGINRDGTLTPLLRGRVDSAIRFEQEQADATGKHAVFVPSGGQGADEVISESEAMSRYLTEQNIPSERIVKEDKSTNTFENMKFSRDVIEAHGGAIADKNIAFATTNYHIFRGYVLAAKNGFDAKGISAKTKFYFYPNAFLREFIGLLVDQKWRHLVAIVLILLFFVGLL